jgi:hypothetical protein
MLRKVAILIVASLMIGVVAAQESEQKVLHIAENDFGKVWANITLTIQRGAEPYLPMVIAVQNKSSKNVTVSRESIWLTDLEGIVYVMPTVKELRKNYNKVGIDYRMISYGGIPWEGWYRNRRLAQSNFFPNLQASRGNTTIDHITLRKGHAMVDLLYFERPRGLAFNRPFFLDVHPKGWEIPIRLRLVLS